MEPLLKEELIRIVGPQNFSDHLMDRISAAYDASAHSTRPDAALWPTRTEQVSRILALANRHGLAVTPRGAGTGLAGSAVPLKQGVVLDLCRMNRIREIRSSDRQVVVEPGVVYADLERAIEPYGFFFPPDPASARACTLGGNVATNAGGLRGAKYGVTRDYVAGLEAVLPDGRILRTSRGRGTAFGYDLISLLAGSEGTLAVITEIVLKVLPKPPIKRAGVALFPALGDAGRSVADILAAGLLPSALEILDEHAMAVLEGHADFLVPGAKALVLVEADGHTLQEVMFQLEGFRTVFQKNRALDVRMASSVQEGEILWQARKRIGSLAARLRPANVSEDVTVPISRVPDLLEGISRIVGQAGLPFVIFGHAGDGNMHPRIMYDPGNSDEVKRLHRAVGDIFGLACRLNGTLSGEHGIGVAKGPYMTLEHDPLALDVMARLKQLFDPNDILNPGKMGLISRFESACRDGTLVV